MFRRKLLLIIILLVSAAAGFYWQVKLTIKSADTLSNTPGATTASFSPSSANPPSPDYDTYQYTNYVLGVILILAIGLAWTDDEDETIAGYAKLTMAPVVAMYGLAFGVYYAYRSQSSDSNAISYLLGLGALLVAPVGLIILNTKMTWVLAAFSSVIAVLCLWLNKGNINGDATLFQSGYGVIGVAFILTLIVTIGQANVVKE